MYERFKTGQKVQIDAFEDLPQYHGTITDAGEDFIGVMVTDKANIPETYAEIYEEQFHLVTVLEDDQ